MRSLARTMHKFSTAAPKSPVLPALHSVGLLNVLKSTFAGAFVARLVRPVLSPLRDENLCIIRALAPRRTARVRLRGATRKRVPLARLVIAALATLRYENLCIMRARHCFLVPSRLKC